MRLFLLVAGVYLAGFFAHARYLGKTVYGDGIYYYAWLAGEASKYSVGPALFWAPVYFLTHNQFAVGAATVLATIFALILLWNLLQKYFNKTISLMTVVTIAGATNLLFYGSVDVVNSHALTFFAATVFVVLLLHRRYWFCVGIALGIVGLMRTQDLLYGLLLIPYIRKNNIVQIISGVLVGFFPQLLAWHLVSGKFWVSPYFFHEGFNFLHPHVPEVLFSPKNGLFLWTPITLVGTLGLILSKKYWFLAVFLSELFVVASWSTWWQGASYSGRMFVSSLPLLSFGVAAVFSELAKYRFTQTHFLLTIVIPLSLINALSIVYFLFTLH